LVGRQRGETPVLAGLTGERFLAVLPIAAAFDASVVRG